ncbi:MAG: thioredoxin family protein [Chromatiales bacterium]|nr:thioredoxin family protein [Chromatiales bacterium]
MKPHICFALVVASVLALAACQDRTGVENSGSTIQATSDTSQAGINWYYGDIDKAFATAREENRPLFMFWSAEWCPDCAQVKGTIFNQRSFIDRTRLFLPVWLDGDTDRGQQFGDQFGVFGYPTMIIFAADGTQITRLPGTIDADQYNRALDTALAVMTPVPELLNRLLSDTKAVLGEDECRLLAYYSWEQDNQRALLDLDPAQAFSAMSQACPDGMQVERSRLYVEQLKAMLASGKMSDNEKAQAVEQLIAIVSDPATRLANLDLIINLPGKTIAGLTTPDSDQRQELEGSWRQALDALEQSGSISGSERVYISRALVRMARMDNPDAQLSAELLKHTSDAAHWVDANTTGYERQSAINSAANTLTEAGLYDQCISLLTAELGKSSSTIYYMKKISIAAQKAGKTDQALDWLRKAYDDATGSATRFEWGVNLVLGLVDMTPDQTEEIEQTTVSLINELGQTEGALYNRNVRRLRMLDATFSQWNDNNLRLASLRNIRAALDGICEKPTQQQATPAICEEFLADIQ